MMIVNPSTPFFAVGQARVYHEAEATSVPRSLVHLMGVNVGMRTMVSYLDFIKKFRCWFPPHRQFRLHRSYLRVLLISVLSRLFRRELLSESFKKALVLRAFCRFSGWLFLINLFYNCTLP